MSVIATALKHLIAAGLAGDELVAAIEEIELEVAAQHPVDTAAARRREKDRVYQAERRAERRQNRQTSADSDDGADAPPYEDTSTPLSSETKVSSEGGKSARDQFPRPEWADKQVWADFMANRKRRRMTNTATAHKAFLGDLARLADDEWPPGRLLEHAAAKGWGSINDPRQDLRNGISKSTAGQGNGLRGSRPSPALELARRGAAREAEEAHFGQDGEADWGTGAALSATGSGGP